MYNCPNTETIGSINFISGEAASPDMNFIDPILFRIRTIIHCVTNNLFRANKTSLNRSLFIEVPVPRKESERSCISMLEVMYFCVRGHVFLC